MRLNSRYKVASAAIVRRSHTTGRTPDGRRARTPVEPPTAQRPGETKAMENKKDNGAEEAKEADKSTTPAPKLSNLLPSERRRTNGDKGTDGGRKTGAGKILTGLEQPI